jgi:hypothetical protein
MDDVGGGNGGGDLSDLFGSGNPDDDDDEEEGMVDSSWGEEGLAALSGKKLGIDVQLSFGQVAIEDIKDEARSRVVNAYDSRLSDINNLKDELEMDAKESIRRRRDASSLSKTYEMQNLMDKIDAMTGDFLSSNANSRDGLDRASNADGAMGRDGRGVVWGSWGDVGNGDVAIDTTSGGGRGGTRGRSWGEVTDGAGGGGGLLGGVEAARKTRSNAVDDDDGYDVGMAGTENRVLILADEKKVSAESNAKHENMNVSDARLGRIFAPTPAPLLAFKTNDDPPHPLSSSPIFVAPINVYQNLAHDETMNAGQVVESRDRRAIATPRRVVRAR